jgi:membrane protein required for colicin V production
MNWVDWTILAILSVSTLLSVKRGFVKEALSLAGWVAAFFVAISFSARLSAQLADFITPDTLRYAIAYVLLFAATFMLASLLNTFLAQVVHVTGLSNADRALGTIFGFARGFVVVLVLMFVLRAALSEEQQQPLQQSNLLPHLSVVEEWARQNFADVNVNDRLPWLQSMGEG